MRLIQSSVVRLGDVNGLYNRAKTSSSMQQSLRSHQGLLPAAALRKARRLKKILTDEESGLTEQFYFFEVAAPMII